MQLPRQEFSTCLAAWHRRQCPVCLSKTMRRVLIEPQLWDEKTIWLSEDTARHGDVRRLPFALLPPLLGLTPTISPNERTTCSKRRYLPA
ncbi:uncharacterized protein P884DRAFT_67239 [Thermothelomyces heterothallicus CBS 202.75]|uniref:uncharacterized protein n=1 Tax=Thermothelomyces heterothallicus CBS 202.75 TaxID=1149848 RepID=UPI003743274E